MAKIFDLHVVPKTVVAGQGTTYRLINETVGDTKAGVIMVALEPGMKSPSVHYHVNREAAYIVLEGTAPLMLNGTEHQLKPHTIVFIPPGETHGITCTGKEGFKMIEVYAFLPADRIDVKS